MTPQLPTGADIFWSLVILALLAVEIWALVDIWKSKANQDRKIIWTLLVLFVNPIGAIVWFAAGKKANQ